MAEAPGICTSWPALLWHLESLQSQRAYYGPAYCTALYEWTVHKQAIMVVLHASPAGRDDPPIVSRISVVPFSNEFAYDNRGVWPKPVDSLEFVLDGKSFGRNYVEFYKAKADKYRIRESLRPMTQWWLNGHLLCNTDAPWGTRGLEVLVQMVHEAFMGQPLWPTMWPVFFINRRDFPHRSRLDQCPFTVFPKSFDVPIAQCASAPIVSFYSGPHFQDLVWPTPEAWTNSGQKWAEPVWPKKTQAVFRGTLTGRYTDHRNARLQVVSLTFRRPDLIDAALTGWTNRDRIEWPRVSYNGPEAISNLSREPIIRMGGPMSREEQMQYSILIYVPGHVAAERLDWYLRSGCCIVVVEDPSCMAPAQFADTLGHGEYQVLANGLHYVKTTVQDLEATLESLLADQARCERIGRAAYLWASRYLSRASMWGQMRQVLIA